VLRGGRRGPDVDVAALATWGWSRVAVLLVAATAGALFGRAGTPFLALWRQWDVVHYEAIARGGYDAEPGTPLAAFFPGLPLVLRVLGWTGLDLTAAGLLVSAVAGAVAAVALARLGTQDGGPEAGRRSVLLLVLAPPAVFLAAGYTEALFLALALLAWLCARSGRWWTAGLLAAGATSVRVSGLFLAAGLAVEWLTGGPRRREDLPALLLPAVPVLAFGAYLRATQGSWLAWADAQRTGWYRQLTDPVTAFGRTWDAAFGGQQTEAVAVLFRLELVAVLVGVVVTVWLLVARRWGEATYVGLSLTALATSTWWFSVPRAALLWWPLWTGLAALTLRRRWVLPAYLALAAPLSVLVAAAFVTGRWAG
jgi:hypothetical protein